MLGQYCKGGRVERYRGFAVHDGLLIMLLSFSISALGRDLASLC